MKNFLSFFILFSLAVLLVSCAKKPESLPPGTSTTTGTTPVNTGTVDVYVAGYTFYTTSGNAQACYWKNGTEVLLGGSGISRAFSVVVIGSDVYVSGSYGTPEMPAIWKNGQLTSFSGGPGERVSCLAALNTTLYAGVFAYTTNKTVATTALYVTISGTNTVTAGLPDAQNQPEVYSIAASGSTVYSAGAGINVFSNTLTETVPVYWVGSNEHALTFPTDFTAPYKFGGAAGIALSGKDVYIVGTAQQTASYDGSSISFAPVIWKNNVATILGETAPGIWTGGLATGIAISNNDIYVSGYLAQINGEEPVFWKNGIVNQLPQQSGDALPSGIAVNGSDTYICGNDGVAYTNACYWKNGTEVSLTDGTKTSVVLFLLYTRLYRAI